MVHIETKLQGFKQLGSRRWNNTVTIGFPRKTLWGFTVLHREIRNLEVESTQQIPTGIVDLAFRKPLLASHWRSSLRASAQTVNNFRRNFCPFPQEFVTELWDLRAFNLIIIIIIIIIITTTTTCYLNLICYNHYTVYFQRVLEECDIEKVRKAMRILQRSHRLIHTSSKD